MDNTVYWIWLSLSVVPGSNLAGKLIGAFGSPEAVYEAERNDFLSLPFSVGDGMGMLCSKDLTAAEKTWEYCLKYGKPGGGYIYCTSNIPFKGLPLDRYRLVLDVWKKYRDY